MAMRDPVDEIASVAIADMQMEETKAYLEKGRTFERVAVEELQRAWVAAFNAVAHGDDAQLPHLADLGAELRLRNLTLPEHLIPQATMKALGDRVAASTPEEHEAVAENIGRLRQRWSERKN